MADSDILLDGPWQHRTVHAHGARFHVATMGSGPLVLLLHGFPTFWWLWRNVMPAIAGAGFTVAAMDLRGYGASDHPPRGYDPRTLAADAAGVCLAMGFESCVVVGHGVGGLVAWTAGTLQAGTVRAVASVGAAHPNALRTAMLTDAAQVRALGYAVGLQWPFLAERTLTRDGAQWVGDLISQWAAPGTIDLDAIQTYRRAFLNGNTPHCAIEFHRWAMRSLPRADGREFARDMLGGVAVPVLQVHGSADTSVLLETASASREFATGSYESHVLDCGHLVPEQQPGQLAGIITDWLGGLR